MKVQKKKKHLQNLLVAMNKVERSKPMEEQFPFLLIDLDRMNATADKQLKESDRILKSLAHLERHQLNKSDDMEACAIAVFMKWLEKQGYDDVFEVTSVKDGEIKASNGNTLVQWDGMISARKDGRLQLFLLEVKQIPNKFDILCPPVEPGSTTKPRRDLAMKIERSLEYLRVTVPQHLEITKFGDKYRMQLRVLQDYAHPDTHISAVYASGLMNAEVEETLEELATKFQDGGVDILWAMCPRFESCEVTRARSNPSSNPSSNHWNNDRD